jgi:hypothetical protein
MFELLFVRTSCIDTSVVNHNHGTLLFTQTGFVTVALTNKLGRFSWFEGDPAAMGHYLEKGGAVAQLGERHVRRAKKAFFLTL